MTGYDLRLMYRKDTGLEALPNIPVIIESECWEGQEEPEDLELSVAFDTDEVPYIEWLEEKLLKQFNNGNKL